MRISKLENNFFVNVWFEDDHPPNNKQRGDSHNELYSHQACPI